MSEEAAREVLAEVDRDKDGRIDYDEFARMMLNDAPEKRHHASEQPQQPQQQQQQQQGRVTVSSGGAQQQQGQEVEQQQQGTGERRAEPNLSTNSVVAHTMFNAKSGGGLEVRQKALQAVTPADTPSPPADEQA
jgi:alanyl-tRNA synthetase